MSVQYCPLPFTWTVAGGHKVRVDETYWLHFLFVEGFFGLLSFVVLLVFFFMKLRKLGSPP